MKKNWFHAAAPIGANFLRFEPYFFMGLLLLNLLTVFGVEVFFTGDGPAHLYNANIITQLIFDDQSPFGDFFELRKALIPNLGGHILLSLFNVLFPAIFAEKLVFGLALLGLPISFRYLILTVRPANVWLSYWGFLLAHNFCLYIGFQSFCLGIGLSLFSLAVFIRASKKGHLWLWIGFGLIFFVTAIFHLFAAAFAALLIATFGLFGVLLDRHVHFRSLAIALLVTLPTIFFCAAFIFSNSAEITMNANSFSDMVQGVLQGVPLITHDTAEKPISITFNILLLLGTFTVFFQKFNNGRKIQLTDFAGLSAILLFVLYFLLPDKLATGGFVSIRLLLCAFIAWALWCSLEIRANRFVLALMATLVVLNLAVIYYHVKHGQRLSDDAISMIEASKHIPSGSTVIPLNYTPHWLQYNIGLYLGTQRNLVVLDNYEASTEHFPVMWKKGMYPAKRLGNFTESKRPLLEIEPYEEQTGQTIDAVVRWDYRTSFNDSATVETNELLNRDFHLEYSSHSGKVQVYLRNHTKK